MDHRQTAELQVVLEGVSLPARKRELIAYARREDAVLAGALEALPDREYGSLDEVADALLPVQPRRTTSHALGPREESGEPPGGADYVNPSPEPGAVRPSAPPDNPPQKALEQQSKTQKEQQARQEQLG